VIAGARGAVHLVGADVLVAGKRVRGEEVVQADGERADRDARRARGAGAERQRERNGGPPPPRRLLAG
jgi:hypothetical protein